MGKKKVRKNEKNFTLQRGVFQCVGGDVKTFFKNNMQ